MKTWSLNISESASGLRRSLIVVMLGASLVACTTTPDSIVQQPTTAKPQQPALAASGNGAIFQVAAYRPLFEDRRARMVGDTLTITLNEKTSASKALASSDAKSSSAEFAIPKLFGVPATTLANSGVSSSSANKFEDKGAASSSNNFTGILTVTVIEVQSNGNLVVSGEKQIALDRSTEYIRFSGVVSPDVIIANNVSSTQVADARVEYRTNSRIDKAEVMSQLARFFLSLSAL